MSVGRDGSRSRVLAIIVGLEIDGGKVRDGEKKHRLIKHQRRPRSRPANE